MNTSFNYVKQDVSLVIAVLHLFKIVDLQVEINV